MSTGNPFATKSEFELRPLHSAQDFADYEQIFAEIWRRDEPFVEGELDHADESTRYLGYLEGKPIGGFKVHHYRVNRGAEELACAGVASVGVLPECRGIGIGSHLMRSSLKAMRAQGFSLAALYPYRGIYYRKFGYEFSGYRWQIRCPMDRFPAFEQELPVAKIAAEDVERLDPCYRAFIQQVNGANLRTSVHWKKRLGKRAPMIYAVGDPIEAYVTTAMDGGFWEDLSFGELAWSTPRGYASIMAFMRGLGINRSALVWSEPSHGPFLARFLDQGAEITLHRPAMYRILNLETVLTGVQSDVDDQIVVRIEDPDLPENNGTWEWTLGPEGSTLLRTADEPDLIASIGAFTQAFLGEPGLERLVAAGSVAVADLDRVAYLFPAKPVLCTEFF